MNGCTRRASLDEVLDAVFSYGPATKTDLLTGAVAARADSSVYEALLRLPDGIYQRPDDVAERLSATALIEHSG